MWTPSEYQRLLKENGAPEVDGDILDLRWIASRNDWYARTAKGWLWLDERTKQWKPAPQGPPH